MSRFRLYLLLSGLIGLFACAMLAAVSVWLVASARFKPLLPIPAVALLFGVVFAAFSLAEIPMMVYAMRRLVVERKRNYTFVLILNGTYVFFAAVYGVPVLLLTGSIGWGLALSSLSILRFFSSLLF